MRTRKIIGATALACTAVVAMAAPAFAHVSVNPRAATKGGFQTLTFQVPNETESANTTGLEVQLPADDPFAFVSVQPKAGWTYAETRTPLPTPVTNEEGQQVTDYISEISWTGGQIKPGEFDTFAISVGTLPEDVDSLAFPAVQTYDDGETVSWIEPTVEGQAEPEHPAPVLQLVAAEDSTLEQGSDASASSAPAVTATVVKKETNNTLGIIALIVGAVGVVIGAVALSRARGGRGAQT